MSDVPFMHEKEYKFIESHLNNQMTMLEWGSGGSTLYFSKLVKNYHSIEHDQEWYDKIEPQIDDNVIYHHIPSSVPWERPSDWRENPEHHNTPVKYFEEYINFVDELDIKFDCVLVDGRCRVHCAIKALSYLKDDGVLFFHDFYPRRKYGYYDVLYYYDPIGGVEDTTQTVIGLRKKDISAYRSVQSITEELEMYHDLGKVR
jgi:hypothetical protein